MTSPELEKLVKALKDKGFTSHLQSWQALNRHQRNYNSKASKVIPPALNPEQLVKAINDNAGLEWGETKAKKFIKDADLGGDGKLGFQSWSRIWTEARGTKAKCSTPDIKRRPQSASPYAQPLNPRPASGARGSIAHNRPITAQKCKSPVTKGLEVKGLEAEKKPAKALKPEDKELEVEEWLEQELRQIIGLEKVKQQMRSFLKNLKLERRRKELGVPLSSEAEGYDMVFYGNPGTGKTSVARLIPKLLQKLGVLKKPSAPFLEVGRGDLVGAYIGATEQNCLKKIEEAKGGIIFIDEAYTLTPGGASDGKDFGLKALEIIMQCMTSNEKERPLFIFAGYKLQMESFLQANPGMARRIAYKFHFEDYGPDQLAQISLNKAKSRGLELTAGAKANLSSIFTRHFTPQAMSLWNGGLASRLVSDAVQVLNDRLDPTTASRDELCTLTESDLELGAVLSAEAVNALNSAMCELAEKAGDISSNENLAVGSEGQSLSSSCSVSTLHLKKFWPSAMQRIAALEDELVRVQRASSPIPEDGSCASEGSLQEVVRLATEAANAAAREDANYAEEKLRAAIAALQQAGGTGLDQPTPPMTSRDPSSGVSQGTPPMGIMSSHDSSSDIETETMALFLAAVKAGHLNVGDEVPAAWRDGFFRKGELVVAYRSDGRKTVARISEVKPSGYVELLVAAVPQTCHKVVPIDRVGKLHEALDEYQKDSASKAAASTAARQGAPGPSSARKLEFASEADEGDSARDSVSEEEQALLKRLKALENEELNLDQLHTELKAAVERSVGVGNFDIDAESQDRSS